MGRRLDLRHLALYEVANEMAQRSGSRLSTSWLSTLFGADSATRAVAGSIGAGPVWGRLRVAGQLVEVLCGAAHGALADQFDQSRPGQFGDVVVDPAQRCIQLIAQISRREDPAAVDPQNLED